MCICPFKLFRRDAKNAAACSVSTPACASQVASRMAQEVWRYVRFEAGNCPDRSEAFMWLRQLLPMIMQIAFSYGALRPPLLRRTPFAGDLALSLTIATSLHPAIGLQLLLQVALRGVQDVGLPFQWAAPPCRLMLSGMRYRGKQQFQSSR